MKIPGRKNKQTGRSPQSSAQRSTPVMRYYRPDQGVGRRQDVTVPRPTANKSESRRFTITPARLFRLMVQWAGAVAVGFVLLANLTLSNFTILAAESPAAQNTYQFRSDENYRDIIQNILDDSLLNSTKLTLSSRKVEEQIRSQLPEVDQASVIIPLVGRKLQVKLSYAQPLMRLVAADNRQGVIGENGMVFIQDEASIINEGFADLPSLTMPNLEAEPGQPVLTVNEAALLTLLKAEFDGSDKSLPRLKSVELMIEQRELRVRFSDANYYAKLTSEEHDSREQVGTLVASLRQLKGEGKLPAEYIDVRVQGRVFVK